VTYKENTGDALLNEARRLGVSTDEIGTASGRVSEPILQERVRAAKIARWARNSWIVALISAAASLVSAIAAWIAIIQRS